MTVSKAWEWDKETSPIWLEPSEESYYLCERWKKAGFRRLLDFGCGLGRHAVLFARSGFQVSAFDLSEEGVEHLKRWAIREELSIDIKHADMLSLPYAENSFDCLFAYHVISHTDSKGIRRILSEIRRVLKPDGEFFITLCSKESSFFRQEGCPRPDENTVVKTCEGPEKGVAHFYVGLSDVFALFEAFKIHSVRHTDDCYIEGLSHESKHFFILGSLQ